MYRTKKQVLEEKETEHPIPISPIILPQPVIKMDTPAYWYEGKEKPKTRYMKK